MNEAMESGKRMGAGGPTAPDQSNATNKLATAGPLAGASRQRQSFPRSMRLLKRAEYEAVYGSGQRRSSSQFSVFFRARTGPLSEPSGQENPQKNSHAQAVAAGAASRFGISVKKALGGAVVRNRIRRRIREILRRHQTEIPLGWDIVIHPRPAVARAPFASIEAELVTLLRGIRSSGPKP